MGSLFDEAAGRRLEQIAPLAQRLRPAGLDGFVGQEQVVGPKAARFGSRSRPTGCRRSCSTARPGPGKTTLARIVAGATGADFEELSAVSATVANVREVLARARERLGTIGRRTILFLDEIHRFNKAQQDALLPGVEDGVVTLIGATTENPYFALNSALLSRMQVYELQALTPEQLREIVRRGAAELGAELSPEVEELIARARRAATGEARSGSSSWPCRRAGPEPVSARLTSRTRPASGRSSTTARAIATTTRSRPGSSRRARATCRRPSTTWR